MANVNVSVRLVQRGLIGGRVDPAPGPADGKWGPRTHQSLRSYVMAAAPGMGLDPVRVMAPLRLLTYYDSAHDVIGARTISLPDGLASHLERMAAQYNDVVRRQHRTSVVEAPPGAVAVVSHSAPVWPWVLGGTLIALGLGYWLHRRMR